MTCEDCKKLKQEIKKLLEKFNTKSEKFAVSFDEDLYHAVDVDTLLTKLEKRVK